MNNHKQCHQVEWLDGTVPVSARFQDPFFSRENGLAESRHVFLAGNRLPDRFRDGFHIAELGFGTGLNMLVTLDAWLASGTSGILRYTSFEAFSLSPLDLVRALDAFPEICSLAEQLLEAWIGGRREFAIGPMSVEIIEGDARETMYTWPGLADAWFLDGFAPAKNPELWESGLLRCVAMKTQPFGTVATYSAAGTVRRSLVEAGFEVCRRPGFGRKRHMTVGQLRQVS